MQGEVVAHQVVLQEGHHLPGADEGVEQFRVALDEHDAQRAAPRFAQHVDLLLSKTLAQQQNQGVGVLDVAFRRERGAVHGVEGLARARLFPVDDDEMLLQPAQGEARGRQLAAAGPPARKSSTGLLASCPRIEIHCWLPLSVTCSSVAMLPGSGLALRVGDGRRHGESLRGDHGQHAHQQVRPPAKRRFPSRRV